MSLAKHPAVFVTDFIDRHLLSPQDRALARRPARSPGEALRDLLDTSSLAKACESIEPVFHGKGACGGLASVASVADVHRRVHFDGTKNLLAAGCGQANLRQGECGRHGFPY